MRANLHYGEHVLPYEVRIQPGRVIRKVAIHIEPDGRVLVDAPESASEQDIHQAVRARVRWIFGHVAAAKERLRHVLPREYVSGESLHYLGRRYRLKVALVPDAPITVRLRGGYIEVLVPQNNVASVKAGLQTWYRQRARVVFQDRVTAVAHSLVWLKVAPPIRLLNMRSQWGSCSPAGLLTLNPHLVKASRECLDYVVLHELCHLKEHNHSPRFYALLDKHMPGWQRVKQRLDALADLLVCE
jgi:predicted metal-dependent hydrolase